jgi:hypothetical protein
MRMATTRRMTAPASHPHCAKAEGRESTTDPTAVIVSDSVELASSPWFWSGEMKQGERGAVCFSSPKCRGSDAVRRKAVQRRAMRSKGGVQRGGVLVTFQCNLYDASSVEPRVDILNAFRLRCVLADSAAAAPSVRTC